MRSKSVDVLNDADKSQRIIDWMLFTSEQNSRLYDNNDGGWEPGAPLFEGPEYYLGRPLQLPGGQWVRPMIDLIGLEMFNSDTGGGRHLRTSALYKVCENCDVRWRGESEDSKCFVCGLEFSKYETVVELVPMQPDRVQLPVPPEMDFRSLEERAMGGRIVFDVDMRAFLMPMQNVQRAMEQMAPVLAETTERMRRFTDLYRVERTEQEIEHFSIDPGYIRGVSVDFAVLDEADPVFFHYVQNDVNDVNETLMIGNWFSPHPDVTLEELDSTQIVIPTDIPTQRTVPFPQLNSSLHDRLRAAGASIWGEDGVDWELFRRPRAT